jgi:hypothetical protein
VKDALSVDEGDTLTIWLTLVEPEPLVTVKATEYEPDDAKVWFGFWTELVAPSLKSQSQEVGFPTDVSVNWTDWPAEGEAGLKLKEAASATVTVTVRLAVFDPEPFVTVKLTVFDPAAA